MKELITRFRETGDKIDEFATYEEAKAAIAAYEAEDKEEGNFTDDFYEICLSTGDPLTPKYIIDKDNILTAQKAKELKGKTILWSYMGYNPTEVEELVVGDFISEYDYYKHQPCKGYKSRTDEWESWMTDEQIQRKKETLILLDEKGRDTCIRVHCCGFYREPTCTCSDADREVYFII